LESSLSLDGSKIARHRIADLITQLRDSDAQNELDEWLADNGKDTLKGMYCMAKFIFPEIDYGAVNKQFAEILAAVQSQIKDGHSALGKVKIINKTLFKKYKFKNNFLLNYDTTGHFIHLALEQRKINPISLVLLYLCFAERLNIAMKVITLPNNFILFCDEKFYINPALNGDIFGQQKLMPDMPETPMKSIENADVPCSDSVMMLFHLTRALREVYDRENKPALGQQIDVAIQALAEQMGITLP
jgi:regulator of sirC expression with transglutaminase-like and TPR domain